MVRGTVLVATIVVLTAGCASSTTTDASPTPTRRSSTTRAVAHRTTAPGRNTGGRFVPRQPIATAGCSSRNGLPDARCTPGATDPRVTQSNIARTICVPGYTKTVRPRVSMTTPIKRTQLVAYGDRGPLSSYELDHLIPLELGGAPASVANLWPEPWQGALGARAKD